MTDQRLKGLCRSWKKIAQETLSESEKVHNLQEKEYLQHKAAIHLNLVSGLKSIMFDSLSDQILTPSPSKKFKKN